MAGRPRKASSTVQVNFRFPPELYERLRDLAEQRGLTMTKVVVEELEALVNRQGDGRPQGDVVAGIEESIDK